LSDSAAFTLDDADVQALRNAVSHVSKIGYCEALVCDRLGLSDLTSLLWRAIPIYRSRQLAERDVLAIAIDLFLLQGLISPDELNKLFDKDTQELFLRAGLISLDEKGRAHARASLFPVGNRLIFSDLAWPMLSQAGYVKAPSDQVMFVGNDSRWLARATVRRPYGAALDLCTGSGIHAILAAFHSQRVVAVDINPRAARCTSFNSQASGAANIEVSVGDLYEPVGEERFDLITANPPFVPSPANLLLFRDGGQSGEDVQSRIIAGLPKHLAKGGIAQIVTEFGEREGEPLSVRLREWLGGAPMDIFILRLREYTGAEYAIGHADGDESYDTFLSSVHDWFDNLNTQKYTRIVSVLLAFQWSDPAESPLTIVEESEPPQRDAGDEIEAAFQVERLLRNHSFREKLIQSRLRLAGPIGFIESWVLGGDIHANTQAKLLGKALPITHLLAPLERAILVMAKESPSVLELLESARGLNLEEEAVLTAIGSVFRRGLVFLTPVHSDP